MNRKRIVGMFGAALATVAATASLSASVSLPAVQRPERAVPPGLQKTARPHTAFDVMRAVAPEGKILQGHQNTSSYGVPRGVYRMNTDAELEKLFTNDYIDRGYSMTAGWMREGRLCMVADLSIFDIVDLRYLEVDPFTGEILTDNQIPLRDPVTEFVNYLPAYWSAAYDESKDRVYGYTSSENGQGYAFFSAPGNDPSKSVCVRTPDYKEICISLAFNPEDGMLYGVNRNDDLVKINPATGLQTVVMPTGVRTRYAIAGMVYVPESGKFLLETMDTDYTNTLSEIDLNTQTLTHLAYFDNFEQFPILYLADASADPAPIRAPQFDDFRFDHSRGEAEVSFFVPTEYFAGGSVEGAMDWTCYLDGVEYDNGTTQAGDIVTVQYTGLNPAEHTFGLSVAQDGLRSSIGTASAYVGYDVPLAPTDVVLTENRIEWTGVTRCENGGYLDPAVLKYHVMINGEEVGVTSDTFFDYTLPVDAPYCAYTASVVADNMDRLSGAAYSSSIRYGAPWEPDFTILPTSADAQVCSVFDLNQDKDYWQYYDDKDGEEGVGYFASPLGNGSDSNDWLFMPPINFDDTDAIYEISFEMGNFNSYYPEMEFASYLHPQLDPRDIAITVFEKRAIGNSRQYDTYTHRFTVSTPGTYYLSFFNDAPIYETGVRVRNIQVKKLNVESELPTGVSSIEAVGAEKGELKAFVSFVMPTNYVTGEKIADDVRIEALISNNDVTVSVSGTPGEKITAEIATVQGFNHISVVPSIGNMQGSKTYIDVYTGVDVPGPVATIGGYVTEDNLSLVASWTAPTESENGYYIDPEDVVYNLMEYGEEGWEIVEVLGKNVYEYTYSVPAGSTLATTRFGIAPSTEAGICSTVAWLTDALGVPHSLPMLEEFEDASFKYGPIRIIRLNEDYADSEWGVVNPRLLDMSMEVESGVSCYGRSEGPTQNGMLMLPKFDLSGVSEPGIIFNCWTGNGAADVTIYGETFDSDGFVTLGKFPTNGSGWQSVEIPFPAEFVNKKWAALYIDAFFPTENHYALFSSYEIRGGVSSVQNLKAGEGWIVPGYGEIVASDLEGEAVSVWSLDGKLVWSNPSLASERVSIPVVGGTYIVRAGSQSLKVMVR